MVRGQFNADDPSSFAFLYLMVPKTKNQNLFFHLNSSKESIEEILSLP